jgi:hypothetical protein
VEDGAAEDVAGIDIDGKSPWWRFNREWLLRRDILCRNGLRCGEWELNGVNVMADETNATVKAPAVTPTAPAVEMDLSAEIIANVETAAGETVRCVRVYGDNYRCNWWGHVSGDVGNRPLTSGFEVTELRVRRSSFFKAKKTADGLKIELLSNFVTAKE